MRGMPCIRMPPRHSAAHAKITNPACSGAEKISSMIQKVWPHSLKPTFGRKQIRSVEASSSELLLETVPKIVQLVPPLLEYSQVPLPVVAVTASGGARMQEGILSLMQMPKTVCAVEDLHDAGGALFVVMAHPTTAGVLASFASLGDVVVAEPGALIAFTGPRVVQQTTREKLPDDFALSEQNLRFGHLDAILPRREQRLYLARLLRLFGDAG